MITQKKFEGKYNILIMILYYIYLKPFYYKIQSYQYSITQPSLTYNSLIHLKECVAKAFFMILILCSAVFYKAIHNSNDEF